MLDCQDVKSNLSAFVDGHVVESERQMVLAHLRACLDCRVRCEQLTAVRDSLHAVSPKRMPPMLAMSLRVAASREAARRRRYQGVLGRVRAWGGNFAFHASQLMRPLAVPAAGGLVSAVFLFTMVLTTYQGIVRAHVDDVPTILATGANVMSSLDLNVGADNIVVDIYVDEAGRVIDYTFPEGYSALNTSATRRALENSLLFTRFQPATSFGQPVSGWVRVSMRRSAIDVKG